MKVTATELKNRLGRYLDAAETEAVIIEKSGREKSVLISHAQYQKLLGLEPFEEQGERDLIDTLLQTPVRLEHPFTPLSRDEAHER